jgi:hypothetical protein
MSLGQKDAESTDLNAQFVQFSNIWRHHWDRWNNLCPSYAICTSQMDEDLLE